MVGFSIICDIHDGSSIVSIGMIFDVLDSSVRQVDVVFALHVAVLVPVPFLSKVCVVFVIVDSVLVVEGIWMFVVVFSPTMASSTNSFRTTEGCDALHVAVLV